MFNSNNNNSGINDGAKEKMSSTIIWLQIGAYTGFAGAALSTFSLFQTGDTSSIISIALAVFLAFTLLQQSQNLKQYTNNNDIKAYEESLKHENTYWLTMMILFIILISIVALACIGLFFIIAMS